MKPTAEPHRINCALAALPLLALLAACGGGGGGGAPINSASALPPPPPPPAPPDPAPPPLDTPEYRRSTAAVSSGVLSAWSLGWTGRGVTVGIVDSGIADSSPEFAGRMAPASRDVTGAGRPITDSTGHGTAVAGILAAARNNSQIVGLAPDVAIAAMRADTAGSCGAGDGCRYLDSAIAAGIDGAVAAGARAVNVSLGGGSASSVLRNAIARATGAGVVIVISAGNDAQAQVDGLAQSFLSAGDPRLVIVAGGLGETGAIAEFSNRAGTVQANYITALAERIRSFDHTGQAFLYSGTSFATPQITAAVALMAQAFPNLTGAQIVDLILGSAADIGAPGTDAVFGRGRLDLARAFAPRGATSLAGTTLAISLDSNGNLGSALGGGVQLGSALGAVAITDGYGRDYQLAIGRTLRPAGNARLGGALVAQALHRETQQVAAGGFAISMGFAATGAPQAEAMRRQADESHLGLAHRGMDRHAGVRNPVREASLAIRRGAFGLTAAAGPAAGALMPGAAYPGLVAPDGLEPDIDQARAERHMLMADWQHGPLRLAIAHAAGHQALGATRGLSLQSAVDRTVLAAAMPIGPAIALSLRWTRLAEDGAFLGTRLSPAFGLHGATSDLAGASLAWTPSPGWQLRAAATRGWHRAATGADGLFMGDTGIASLGWSAALAGPAPIGQWTLRLAQPLAVTGGGFRLGAESRLVPLAVDAPERVAELGWAHGGLGLTGYWRANPGHRQAAPDIGAALRLQQLF